MTISTSFFRGDVRIELTSPFGTTSVLIDYRDNDLISGSYFDWPFMSVHYWGENPSGVWNLTITYRGLIGSASMNGLNVTFYGTDEVPQAIQQIPAECDPACARGCAASGADYCDACTNLRNAETLECISVCPIGFTQTNSYCYNASLPEPICQRNISGKSCPLH